MSSVPAPAFYRQAIILSALVAACLPVAIQAADLMPTAEQNALVRRYCAVCHTDAAKNGGLSLEHFDAAKAAPSLTAMMLSKLTSGVSLKTAGEAPFNSTAAALIDRKMRAGAMGAASIPIPDKATIDALIRAFAVEAAGATEWTVERFKDAAASAPLLTASILREAPSAAGAGEAEAYRLIASCNPATRQGEVQLAWSPVPQSGTFVALVDSNAAAQYHVEGSEKMANGSGLVLHRLASSMLAESKPGMPRTGLAFPAESLTIRDLFPGETVTFSFANLPEDARRELNSCFPGAGSSNRVAASISR